jgi:ligand-binding sensor domain-containing protein
MKGSFRIVLCLFLALAAGACLPPAPATPVGTVSAPPPTPQPTAVRMEGEAAWQVAYRLEGLDSAPRYITRLAAAPDGTLWMGSDNDGAFHYDGSAWRQFTQEDGLADNSVHDFAFGPDGAVWAVTWFGVSRFDGETWHTTRMEKDFMGNDFHSLAISPDGRVWVGGGEGLMYLEDEAWEPALPDSHYAIQAYTLWADPDGSIWYGGYRTLNRVARDGITSVLPPATPDSIRFTALLRSADGALWIGSTNGLYRYQDEVWLTPGGGLPVYQITSLASAPDGTLWVGSAGQGLLRFDGESWRRYTTADGLLDDWINAVAVTPDGTVWAGTAGGLNILAAGD